MEIEVAELIGELRAELDAATRAGEGAELRFEAGPVELELTVAVSKEGKGGAKVRFWVVDLDAEGKLGSATTQKIKLTLQPRRVDQPDTMPLVAGDQVVGEVDDRGGR